MGLSSFRVVWRGSGRGPSSSTDRTRAGRSMLARYWFVSGDAILRVRWRIASSRRGPPRPRRTGGRRGRPAASAAPRGKSTGPEYVRPTRSAASRQSSAATSARTAPILTPPICAEPWREPDRRVHFVRRCCDRATSTAPASASSTTGASRAAGTPSIPPARRTRPWDRRLDDGDASAAHAVPAADVFQVRGRHASGLQDLATAARYESCGSDHETMNLMDALSFILPGSEKTGTAASR